ncbi:Hint domain-containing protein [Roseobacter sinensis]|uniref:Hint domain-containing protein n=1 Tax=Roseobacter sinensis TaxID=2931391 RepID=A0ABT3BC52_9RHOB|nr:Hint domain-containing protein [Roseobacter sp. WL0113]MCV3271162.1 Hint domain-containing protein [Roseobacter sp. WL0113]
MKPRTAGRSRARSSSTFCTAAEPAGHAGLISGAQVLTLKGERCVEALRVGDHVLTRGGALPLTRIDVISALVPCVYVIAGSLGHSRTDRDALLTADQMIFLRDWRATAVFGQPSALVPAQKLVDGEFVRDLGQQLVTLYRLFCPMPQILFADGLNLGTADTAPGPAVRPAA